MYLTLYCLCKQCLSQLWAANKGCSRDNILISPATENSFYSNWDWFLKIYRTCSLLAHKQVASLPRIPAIQSFLHCTFLTEEFLQPLSEKASWAACWHPTSVQWHLVFHFEKHRLALGINWEVQCALEKAMQIQLLPTYRSAKQKLCIIQELLSHLCWSACMLF